MNILIVGGGIAGLTLMRALQRDAHDVDLVEKSSTLRADGAGIMLSINAMRALELIGLSGEVVSNGQTISAIYLSDHNDKTLSALYTDSLFQIYRQPMIAIHRERFHRCLTSAIDPNRIQMGVTVADVREVSNRVDVEFTDGTKKTYDYVIGADGIASQMRSRLYPSVHLRYSGYTCWRFVINYDPGNQIANEMWGRGKRLGVVPIGNGQTYVFATLNAPAKAACYKNISIKAFKAGFSEFGGHVPAILEGLSDGIQLLHNDLCDLPQVCLGSGRILLIGDAAHASTPNLGQGAAMGIEDAVALACILRQTNVPAKVMQYYKAKREQRVKNVRDRSFSVGKIAQLENSLAIAVRNYIVKLTPEKVARKNLERMLFNYEPCLTNVESSIPH